MSASASRRARRAAKREAPRDRLANAGQTTRACVEVAARALDVAWDEFGVVPLLAFVIERGGLIIARVDPIEAAIADLERVSPAVAEAARQGERLRALAAADGVIVVLASGSPVYCGAFGRRDRFLAEEGLEELERIAIEGAHVAAGAEA